MTPPIPSLRKASEFRVDLPAQPGQAHRGAAGQLIDYRLQEVTSSAVRAICTVPGHFADKPTFASPWHYHDCDLQIAVILDGSIELGYRADTYARASRGDLLFIPGHTMHDVGAPSADYQIAEITFPGTFGTVEAPMPAPGAETRAVTLGTRDAVRVGTHGGLVEYRYDTPAPYAIRRFVRSRTQPFEPAAHAHGDRYRMTILVEGWKTMDLGGRGVRAEPGDLLVQPGGSDYRDLAISDAYVAIEVSLA